MKTHTIDPNAVATVQGRELDALIAEHLFGWRVGDISSNRRVPAPALMGKLSEPKNGPDKWLVCPHYTTDPAAFFAMMEAVRAKGWEVVNMRYYRSNRGWYVRLDDIKFRPITAIGDTMSIAFARAALQACLMDTNQKGG